jgi:hypothetical protein
MMIEVQKPELEALIRERMMSGAFQNVEDVLTEALKSSPPSEKKIAGSLVEGLPAMGAELVAAMQASPFKEICFGTGDDRSPYEGY